MTKVYTSIIGGVDNLSDAPLLNEIQFHCYTDSDIKAKNYSVFKEKVGSNKWLESRKFKILSHHYQKGKSLWIDGRVEVKSNVIEFLEKNENHDFILFKHPHSDTIQAEAERCLSLGILKDDYLVKTQLDKYEKLGFSDHKLMAGGIILRNNCQMVKSINELWWKELNEFPTRDEISLPYVLWKLGIEVNVLDLDIFNNPYFKFNKRRLGERNT